MPKQAKVLGQAKPASATGEQIYEVPNATEAIVSLITACNQDGTTADDARLAVRPFGEALQEKHYLWYDLSVSANETVELRGLTLGPGDIIEVQSANGDVSFSVFGIETTLRNRAT